MVTPPHRHGTNRQTPGHGGHHHHHRSSRARTQTHDQDSDSPYSSDSSVEGDIGHARASAGRGSEFSSSHHDPEQLGHVANLLRVRQGAPVPQQPEARLSLPLEPTAYSDMLEEGLSLFIEDLLRADGGAHDPGIPCFSGANATDIVDAEGDVIAFGTLPSPLPAGPIRAETGLTVAGAATATASFDEMKQREKASSSPPLPALPNIASPPVLRARTSSWAKQRGLKRTLSASSRAGTAQGSGPAPPAPTLETIHSAAVAPDEQWGSWTPGAARATSPKSFEHPSLGDLASRTSERNRGLEREKTLPIQPIELRTDRKSSGTLKGGDGVDSNASTLTEHPVRPGQVPSQRQLTDSTAIAKFQAAGAALAQGFQPIGMTDPLLVTFNADGDGHPRNWTKFRKWLATIAAILACLLCNAGFNLAAPIWPEVAIALGATKGTDPAVDSWMGVWSLGLALPPLFVGPISEVFGRKWPIVFGLSFCALCNQLSTLPHTFAPATALRYFAAFGACIPVSLAGSVLADVWEMRDRTAPMFLLGTSSQLGPCLGPIMAGFIAHGTHDWKWVFNVYTMLLSVNILMWLFVSESYIPTILGARARKLRKTTGNSGYHTIFELRHEPLRNKFRRSAGLPFKLLFTEPIVAALGIFLAIIYTISNLVLTNIPTVMLVRYGWNSALSSLQYLPIFFGSFTGAYCAALFLRYRAMDGQWERMLTPAPLSALILCFSLPAFGLAARHHAQWSLISLSLAFISWAVASAATLIQTYQTQVYSQRAAEALTAGIFLRSVLTFAVQYGSFRSDTQIDWISIAWAGSVFIFVPVLLIFWGAGWKLRARSRYARKS